jgi:hypothetical protein
MKTIKVRKIFIKGKLRFCIIQYKTIEVPCGVFGMFTKKQSYWFIHPNFYKKYRNAQKAKRLLENEFCSSNIDMYP